MEKVKESFKNFEKNLSERVGKVEGRLEERLAGHIEDFLLTTVGNLEECESPIEKLLALELDRVVNNSEINRIADVFDWSPQKEIVVFDGLKKEKTYRVDFIFEFVLFGRCDGRPSFEYKFAIECDGHDFHEKTKEQAARDKQKDRDLMQHGITVIRFTGSEIYENPYGSASEAIQIMEKYIRSMYRLN